MTIHVGVGGAHKNVFGISVGVGGAWKTVTEAWVGVGGAWKKLWDALTVTASNVNGDAASSSPAGPVTSITSPNVTVVGGSGSYTYLWAHVSTSSGNTPDFYNSTSATQNPTWLGYVATSTQSISTWRVTVTDNTYGVTATTTITVTLSHTTS